MKIVYSRPIDAYKTVSTKAAVSVPLLNSSAVLLINTLLTSSPFTNRRTAVGGIQRHCEQATVKAAWSTVTDCLSMLRTPCSLAGMSHGRGMSGRARAGIDWSDVSTLYLGSRRCFCPYAGVRRTLLTDVSDQRTFYCKQTNIRTKIIKVGRGDSQGFAKTAFRPTSRVTRVIRSSI